ncbi:MAG: RNA methyltransferase [Clostridia bacterium]
MLIASTNNNTIKTLRSLYKDKKTRHELGVFVCEGYYICRDIPSFIEIEECFVKKLDIDKQEFFTNKFGKEIFVVEDKIFDSVADTKTPSGVICTIKKPEFKGLTNDRVAVLCSITDSGNLGTIIRTATSCGIDDIICIDCADVYSPKVVRATMGGIFYANIVECGIDAGIKLLQDYQVVGLDMHGISIYSYKKSGKTAIAVGSEAHGLPEEIVDRCDQIVSLPMRNDRVESLNAAISMGIAMYLIK